MIAFYAGGFLYNPETKEVLLHKRDGNTDINPHKWAFFGGLSEGDEAPMQTFIREVREELGLSLSDEDVSPLRDYLNVERGTHRYVFCVISETKKEDMILGEGADFDWIPREKVFEYDLTDMTRDDLKAFLKTRI